MSCIRTAIAAALSLTATLAQAKTIYLNPYATGEPQNGASWQTPYRSLNAALDAAVAGDEVWAAFGQYEGPIAMKPGVRLYGGFAGTETEKSQRPPIQGGSSITGMGLGSAVTFGPGTTSATVLDNFYLTGGTGTVVGSYARGGGVYCNQASPTLNNLVIAYNQATYGGAMWLTKSSPKVTNCLITANYSGFQCGGIYIDDQSNPVFEYNTIQTNTVSSFGSGGEGGAMFISNGSLPQIRNNLFRRNASSTYGGAIYSVYTSPSIRNNVFIENESQHGAAIYLDNGGGDVTHNLIVLNTASGHAGGLMLNSTSAAITGNTIASNVARGYGSGGNGGAAYITGTPLPAFTNNILAFNSSGVYRTSGSGTVTFQYNNVYGNDAYNFSGIPDPGTTNGNLSKDPKFVDRLFGDYHLLANSPCINAGRNASVPSGSTDLDGTTRTVGSQVDIGVDEFRSPVYVSPSGNDGNSGASWSQARRSIGAALQLAAPGDQVWVAEGVYAENVACRGGVKLFGGFLYGGDFSTRDWSAHPSVIDGRGAGSCATFEVIGEGARLDGFTLRNGRAASGGGAMIVSSSPVIANCRITANEAIAGAYGGNGGGVCALAGSSPMLVNNIIDLNTASTGAGVWMDGGEPLVYNNTITGNTATGHGGGLYFDVFANTLARFANNIVAWNSSGVWMNYREASIEPLLYSNIVYGNAAYDYGSIADQTGINGNRKEDPLFRNRSGADYRPGYGSPCINAGQASVSWRSLTWPVTLPDSLDYARAPRTNGGAPEIGAFEFAAHAPFAFSDVARALYLVAGAKVGTTGDISRLNIVTDGASAGKVDVRDAARLARKAAGLEPNP
jgi:hypothetical protein